MRQTHTSGRSRWRQPTWAGPLIASVAIVMLLVLFHGRGPIQDESLHLMQTRQLMRGQTELKLAMIPGFHTVMALAGRIADNRTLDYFRVISACFSILAVWFFYGAARRIDPASAGLRTLQFAIFPLLCMRWPLLYTETLAFCLANLALFFFLRGRMLPAAIACLASILVRQTHVIFPLLMFLMPYVETHGLRLDAAGLRAHLHRAWPLLVPVVGVLGFQAHQGGWLMASSTDARSGILTGTGSLHSGNIFLALITALVCLLPAVAGGWNATWTRLRRQLWISGLLLFLFLVYCYSFRADNPWNVDPWYLPNRLLQ